MIGRSPPLIYVAGAYKGNVASNIIKAEAVSIALIRNGWHVFTPHKNTAGYEQYEDNLLNKSTWIEMDLNILDRCDALYIMDNWRISSGTQGEIAFAQKRDIPIFWEEIMPAEALTLQEKKHTPPIGLQEPPDDPRIFNRKQNDGTYRQLSEFFEPTEKQAV